MTEQELKKLRKRYGKDPQDYRLVRAYNRHHTKSPATWADIHEWIREVLAHPPILDLDLDEVLR